VNRVHWVYGPVDHGDRSSVHGGPNFIPLRGFKSGPLNPDSTDENR
jgi:hypothetical protein